jgi:hypothetical protein
VRRSRSRWTASSPPSRLGCRTPTPGPHTGRMPKQPILGISFGHRDET